MQINLMTTDDEINRCYAIMRELRPHIEQGEFLAYVHALKPHGYRLVAMQNTKGPVAVAGFRISESLAWGRYLYVDDLVTLPSQRSMGHGAALLGWLRKYAMELGCKQLHLDSGLSRREAHRFYEREGMTKAGYHFIQFLE